MILLYNLMGFTLMALMILIPALIVRFAINPKKIKGTTLRTEGELAAGTAA